MRMNPRVCGPQKDGRARLKLDVVCFASNPGLADYVVSLSRGLSAQADVRALVSSTIDPFLRGLFRPIECCFRRTRHLPIDLVRYARAVLRRRPDVVLVQSWLKVPLVEILLVRLFQLCRISCVVTVHDVLPHYPRPWSGWVLRAYYRAFDGLVAHSCAAREQLRNMGVTKPIAVIPHGVYDVFDIDGLSSASARERLKGLKSDDYVILFFGFLQQRKGLFDFLQAARTLATDPSYRFVIAGKPDLTDGELETLRQTCRELGVLLAEGHVPFCEVQNYFASCDLVAMPYREGTTSGVLKLAIAFGKPVVCTPIGDVPETVNPDTAVLAPIEDLEHSLVIAIRKAREQAAGLSAGARAERARFAWDRVGSMYFEHVAQIRRGDLERSKGLGAHQQFSDASESGCTYRPPADGHC